MKDEKLKTRQKRRKAENFVFNKGNGEGHAEGEGRVMVGFGSLKGIFFRRMLRQF